MEKEKILVMLTEVFKEVFDLDDVVITPHTVADDIEDWDSLEHINLISAVESTFKMKFKMKEVSTMKNVGEMMDIIAERTKLK
ncbi:MAG: acyl carrier protein [Oscillospiraceae bacterium]|nr:acyl carrier protein [Oscillospiraceae bacterium]